MLLGLYFTLINFFGRKCAVFFLSLILNPRKLWQTNAMELQRFLQYLCPLSLSMMLCVFTISLSMMFRISTYYRCNLWHKRMLLAENRSGMQCFEHLFVFLFSSSVLFSIFFFFSIILFFFLFRSLTLFR